MNDESIDPKEKLRNLLEEGEGIGHNIADQGRERTEEGQNLADLARGTRKVLDTMPDGFPFSSFENAIEYWRTQVDENRRWRDSYQPYSSTVMSSTGSTVTISSFNLPEEIARDIAILESNPLDWEGWVTYILEQLEVEAQRRRKHVAFIEIVKSLGMSLSCKTNQSHLLPWTSTPLIFQYKHAFFARKACDKCVPQ